MENQPTNEIQNFDRLPLTSNNQTVSHGPDKFIIDFKGVYPQFTSGSKPILVIDHKTVLLDPWIAKDFANMLLDNIKKYEASFGAIKRPEPVKKIEKKLQSQARQSKKKQAEKNSADMPTYLG